MPGPKTPEAALEWIRGAVLGGRLMKADHFDARCKKKGYHQYHDPRRIVETATECLWYEDEKGDPTTHGGTPWSVIGLSIEGDVARLGVEAFLSGKDQYVILCSIMQGW